jgi:hypothetical protein
MMAPAEARIELNRCACFRSSEPNMRMFTIKPFPNERIGLPTNLVPMRAGLERRRCQPRDVA